MSRDFTLILEPVRGPCYGALMIAGGVRCATSLALLSALCASCAGRAIGDGTDLESHAGRSGSLSASTSRTTALAGTSTTNTLVNTSDSSVVVSAGSSTSTGSNMGISGATSSTLLDASSQCVMPAPLPPNGLLYNGGIPAPACPNSLAIGWPDNFWFGYFDSATAGTTNAGAFDFIHQAAMPGCDGATSCAFHTTGMNVPGYGAGVGFTLNMNLDFDASQYSGLDVWLKGTTTGTRGDGYVLSNNTVHVKFVTGLDDGGDPRQGDDYGIYCPTQGASSTQWVECRIPFTALTRDAYKGVDAGAPDPATDVFDAQDLNKIQFEFSSYSLAGSGIMPQVTFDLWIDDISFF